tara:strand:- start:254 stop:1051 length:798 start_codon:yes stop_codon:yes gene_type:complete
VSFIKKLTLVMVKNKIDSALWFLKNPQYIPQIFQILRRKKNTHLEDSREESTNWCKENCLSQEEALIGLFGKKTFKPLDFLYSEEIQQAQNIVADCPVNMGGEGAISFLYHIVKESKARFILETGVAYGWSSLAVLLAIKAFNNALLISNDMPYIKMNNEDYVGCVVPENLKSKWQLQRLPDIKGIPLALKKLNNNIDLCHYDSDKSYTGRMRSSEILWKALKVGGFFISDDINDNLAFKHFCKSVDRKPIIIEHLGKYVGVVVK